MKETLERNKQNAINFYNMAFGGDPAKAADLYAGETYIQHNPLVKDGIRGFIEYFNRMKKDYPEKSIEFVRIIAEGDLVALHTHQTWPGSDEYVTMDIFRFNEDGKIVEHWDAVQKIPESAENKNKMY